MFYLGLVGGCFVLFRYKVERNLYVVKQICVGCYPLAAAEKFTFCTQCARSFGVVRGDLLTGIQTMCSIWDGKIIWDTAAVY